MSIQEIAAAYSHIELTEEERLEGEVWAKQKKETLLKEIAARERQAAAREFLSEKVWDCEMVKNFAIARAKKFLGEKVFVLDYHSQKILDLLSFYFSENECFVTHAAAMGVNNPDLKKGILLSGNNGVGKTFMMKIFQRNRRQCYFTRNAAEIADSYNTKEPENGLSAYTHLFPTAVNDPDSFFQPSAGLCIEDLGTENKKVDYGNHSNVLANIFEIRYERSLFGTTLHATTNLTPAQIKDYYGQRALSRMREMFNYIIVDGEDRRK